MTTIDKDEQNRRLHRKLLRTEISTNTTFLAAESNAIQDELKAEMEDRRDSPRFNRRGVFNHLAAMADVRRKRPDLFINEKHEA